MTPVSLGNIMWETFFFPYRNIIFRASTNDKLDELSRMHT